MDPRAGGDPSAKAPVSDNKDFETSQRPVTSIFDEGFTDETQAQTPANASHSQERSRGSFHVPGYQLLEILGQGTYGVVYRAREEATGVEVAIKFFTHGTGLEWQLLQAEVKQLALLQTDPGIILLKDVDPDHEPPFYVMALAEQGCLGKRLKDGPLQVTEALAIFRQVCETLAYVHAKGIRHCDLKPGNILLDARGRARVADFGQAHLASDLAPALGTFFYMAPEQADLSKQVADTRWDVYGLGALLYAMLTGGPPREDSTLRSELADTANLSHRLERYRRYLEHAPPATGHRRVPGVDRALADLVDRCLDVNPDRRFHDAAAILAALDRRDRWRRQRPVLMFALVAPLLLLALLSGLALWQGHRTLEASHAALENQVRQSSLTSARLLAYKVQDQLIDLRTLVSKHAGQQELATLIRTDNRDGLQKALAALLNENKDIKGYVCRCVAFDARGKLLAIYPSAAASVEAVGQNFAYRDYFNGERDYLESAAAMKQPRAPLRRLHLSQPFASTIKGDKLLFCISSPVRDDGRKPPVGVLMAAIRLTDLNQWLSDVTIDDGFAVLVNRHGNVLHHRRGEKLVVSAGQPVPRYQCPVYEQALAAREGSARYDDPVDGKTYLVGYAPVVASDDADARADWGALVQHEHARVIKPMSDLKSQMIVYGIILLVTAGLLLAGLWGGLFWTLRREEPAAHG
jgi:serine/threonine protein kinase